MDWSLVLASQGIEAIIELSEESGAWSLLVNEADHERALQSIRRYRLENRRWRWRGAFAPAGLIFDARSIAWVALAVFFFWLSGSEPWFRDAGLNDSQKVASGETWRLFTAMWLHADVGHLAANCGIGLLLLGLAMGAYGGGAGLLGAYLAGAGGNIFTLLLASSPHRSLGASGMVMGALGLLAVHSLTARGGERLPGRQILTGMAAGLMLFILLGLTPGTDIGAHVGGFMSGVALGGILALFQQLVASRAVNLACALGFAALVGLPWWLAWQTFPLPR